MTTVRYRDFFFVSFVYYPGYTVSFLQRPLYYFEHQSIFSIICTILGINSFDPILSTVPK